MPYQNAAGVTFAHPLWPPLAGEGEGTYIPFFGLIGPYKIGKSTWAANAVVPGKHRLLALDFHEGWSELRRPNIVIESLTGQTWSQINAVVNAVKPGAFDAIAVDTVADLITAARAEIDASAHYKSLGLSRKTAGLYYDEAYRLAGEVLTRLIPKTQTVFVIAHESNIWQGNQPTGQKKPDWAKIADKLATVALWLLPNTNPQKPYPRVRVHYSRLQYARPPADEEGDWEIIPVLPPMLEDPGTPAKFRRYLRQPRPWSELSPEELQDTRAELMDTLSEEARLVLETERAKAEAEAEQARLQRAQLEAEQWEASRQYTLWAASSARSLNITPEELTARIRSLGVAWTPATSSQILEQLKGVA